MEETHTLNTCVCASACVCVGGRGTSYNQATWAPGLGGTRPLFPSPVCDTGWAVSDDCLGLVIDLQLGGMLYVMVSLPHLPPPSLTPPPPSPCFHSRLHNRRTAHKGLSSQVQPRLARIKERFQLKMFFPPFFSSIFFFLGPTTSLLHSCGPPPTFFSPHVIQFLIFLLLVAHFSLMLRSRWLVSPAAHQELSQSGSFFQ